MGVLLVGEVEFPVGWVQVGLSPGPVGDPPHPDLPEHGGQAPGVARFGAGVDDLVGVDDVLDPPLPNRA